jgi:hypothetical protein
MNEEPLDDQMTVLDYSSMLYDVRRQRNELRAEFNIVIRQLEDMTIQRDKYKALVTELLQSVIDEIKDETL